MGGWENELKVMMEINTAPLYPHNIPSTDYPTNAKIKNINLSISIDMARASHSWKKVREVLKKRPVFVVFDYKRGGGSAEM